LAPAALIPWVELALLPASEPVARGATEVPVVGLSTATPVLVVPGCTMPVPAELGVGAFWLAPACANAPPAESPTNVAAIIYFRMFLSS
jgi:hypothetical protein